MNRAVITPEQTQAIRESHGRPVYLVDETGNDSALAIVPTHLLHSLLVDDFTIEDTYRAQEIALQIVWNEPELDEYTLNDGSPID